MSNLLFQNALLHKAQPLPPIWMMRQAGRYHAHYQALRKKHSFMELCKVPELAAEVALGPVMDFDFDVSILFSDLLFPLEAMGMGLTYEDTGPELGFSLTPDRIKDLKNGPEALEILMFQKTAMELTRARLPKNKSLIGFVGGPWTLYVYAVEGGHSGSLTASKSQPELYRAFRDCLMPLLEKNIQLQLDGGAETVMIFDTAAGEVSPGYYQSHVLPDLIALAKKFPGKVGYYSKGTQPAHFAGKWNELQSFSGMGFDHRWSLPELFRLPVPGFVQGCFDQALLFLEPKEFEKEFRRYLEPIVRLAPEERKGWVCGLGHGVLPKTPEANVRKFIQIVREVFQ